MRGVLSLTRWGAAAAAGGAAGRGNRRWLSAGASLSSALHWRLSGHVTRPPERKASPSFCSPAAAFFTSAVSTVSAFPSSPFSSSSSSSPSPLVLWMRRSGWSSCDVLVWALIGCNVGVFLLWRLSVEQRSRYGLMMDHFTVSLRNLREGRVWTLITSAFSQREVGHLLVNCISLYAFARPLCALIGGRRLLVVYLGGAVASSLSHIAYQNVLLPRLHRSRHQLYLPSAVDLPALGASGSAYACTTLFACLFPHSQFLLYFVLPVPAWLCATGLIAYDVWAAFKASPMDRTAHFGHIGGAAFGLLFFLATRRRGGWGAGGSGRGGGGWGTAEQRRGWRGRPV